MLEIAPSSRPVAIPGIGKFIDPKVNALITDSLQDPVLFAENLLQVKFWKKQIEIAKTVWFGKKRRTAVKACHSSGKTFEAACLTLAFLAEHQECKVVTTGPTGRQVTDLIWAEINTLSRKSVYPFPRCLTKELKITPQRKATGFTTSVETDDEGTKFQGYHSPYILVILDEAPGVDSVLWTAIEGLLASGEAWLLALGNPTIPSGPFYDAFRVNRDQWNTFTISAFDTPNFDGLYLKFKQIITSENGKQEEKDVIYGDPNGKDLLSLSDDELDYNPIPYLISRRWVKDKYIEWGPNNAKFKARVLGAFPSQSSDSLFDLSWLELAQNRVLERPYKKLFAGIDVAGPGEDDTVLVVRDGPVCLIEKAWPDADPRGQIIRELRTLANDLGLTLPDFDDPNHLQARNNERDLRNWIELNIDSAGIGYYLAKYFEDLGFIVSYVNVGESSSDSEQYKNLKAELYWGLRMRFNAGDICGNLSDKAVAQLSSIRWEPNSRGQTVIESKEDARKRGVKSPDIAEAYMLAYASSRQHGLFSFWEEQYKTSQQQKPVVIHSDAKSLAEAQSKEAGYTDKFKDDLHDWPLQYKDPRKMDHRAPLANVQGVHGLGKVATSQQQSDKCPNCKDAFVAKYGDGVWRCNVCGENSRSWAEKQNAMQS